MKWSIKLGRWLGIDVYMHVTFLLLLAFIGLAQWLAQQSVAAAVTGVLFFVVLFLCVLLHEYGHALMARRYGIRTRDITLLPIGGVARLERMPEKPMQEFWVAVAGPAVNVGIALVLAFWLAATGSWEPLGTLSATQGGFVERLLVVNLFLVLFNLLPAFPMDGGRVLRSLLALRLEHAQATAIAARVGQGMALLFGFVGLFTNPFLILIAVFVWFGAAQEAAAAAMKVSFAGAPVRDAMVTEFRTITPQHSLADVERFLLAGAQQDFPVLEQGRLVGWLRHQDIFEALRERDDSIPVGAIMRRDVEMTGAEVALEEALARLQGEKGASLAVLQHGHLVGMLTAENLGEFVMLRAARAERRRAAGPPSNTPPPLLRVPPVIPGRWRLDSNSA